MSLFDDKGGLTPEKVSKLAREVVTEQDIKEMVRAAVTEAIGDGDMGSSPQARKFLQDILFPKDSSQFEDVKWKRVVFCTFEEWNNVEQLKKEILKLEAENERLKSALHEVNPTIDDDDPWDADLDIE